MNKAIKISSEDYKKVKEIAEVKKWEYIYILSRAINNYWKSVIGNRLPKKD